MNLISGSEDSGLREPEASMLEAQVGGWHEDVRAQVLEVPCNRNLWRCTVCFLVPSAWHRGGHKNDSGKTPDQGDSCCIAWDRDADWVRGRGNDKTGAASLRACQIFGSICTFAVSSFSGMARHRDPRL